MTQPLEALLARVEEATGPSEEVDQALFVALVCEPNTRHFWQGGERLVGADGPRTAEPGEPMAPYMRATKHGTTVPTSEAYAPEYTASLDAALALVERVLPGWLWTVRCCGGHFRATVMPARLAPGVELGEGSTPALALLAALLRAIISQQKTAQGEGV